MSTYTAQEYVELFHLVLLDFLGRKIDKRLFALKGGGNLRFFLRSPRYSEDMDLDVHGLAKEKLEMAMSGIVASKPFAQVLEVKGVSVTRSSAPKQTETTQRWKFALGVSGSSVPLHTKVEFSRRGMTGATACEPVDPQLIDRYQLGPILAQHYDKATAFEQKVRALVSRREIQARDVFDLGLLLDTGAPHRVSDPALRDRLGDAASNAMSVTFDIFKSQVLSYLSADHRARYDSESTWDDTVLRVVEALQEETR